MIKDTLSSLRTTQCGGCSFWVRIYNKRIYHGIGSQYVNEDGRILEWQKEGGWHLTIRDEVIRTIGLRSIRSNMHIVTSVLP